jgi:hypothetical protein
MAAEAVVVVALMSGREEEEEEEEEERVLSVENGESMQAREVETSLSE